MSMRRPSWSSCGCEYQYLNGIHHKIRLCKKCQAERDAKRAEAEDEKRRREAEFAADKQEKESALRKKRIILDEISCGDVDFKVEIVMNLGKDGVMWTDLDADGFRKYAESVAASIRA